MLSVVTSRLLSQSSFSACYESNKPSDEKLRAKQNKNFSFHFLLILAHFFQQDKKKGALNHC